MKDLFDREIKVGDYIAYALTAGRSANLAVYQVKEVSESNVKAHKLDESYGYSQGNHWILTNVPRKYVKAKWNTKTQTFDHLEMTQEEKDKVDNKTTTLSMPERALILNNFDINILPAH